VRAQLESFWGDRLGRIAAPATGFYNRVISTNRCERSHGYVKSRFRAMRRLKCLDCAKRLFPAMDALQLIEPGFVRVAGRGAPLAGWSYVCARHVGHGL
jgi:hypothetical protein